MKGSYVLIISLDRSQTISVGSRGEMVFSKGYYAYSGSALNSLEARVARHLRIEKRMHWHIDYLLEQARVESVWIVNSSDRLECKTATEFAAIGSPVKGFGCSDCRCGSHLFYHGDRRILEEKLDELGYTVYVSAERNGSNAARFTSSEGNIPVIRRGIG